MNIPLYIAPLFFLNRHLYTSTSSLKKLIFLSIFGVFIHFSTFAIGGSSCATSTTWNFTNKTFNSDINATGSAANSLWYTFDATTIDNYVVLYGNNAFTYKLWKGTCGALTQVYTTVNVSATSLTWVKYTGGFPLNIGTTYYIELIFTSNTTYSIGIANDPYTYTGFWNADPTDSRNYANGVAPIATDNVKIPIASWITINLSANPASVRTITVEKGVTLPIAASKTYTAITNNGTVALSGSNTVLTVSNLFCSSAGSQFTSTATNTSGVDITGTLTVQNGGNLSFLPNGITESTINIGTLQVDNGGTIVFKDYVKPVISGDVLINGVFQLEYANGTGNPSIGGNFTVNGSLNHQGHRYIMLRGTGKTLGGTGNFYAGRTAPIQISGDETVTGANYTLTNSIRLTHFFVGDGDGGGEIDGTFNLGANTLSTAYFIQEGVFNQNTGMLVIEGPTTFVQSGGFFNGRTWELPDAPVSAGIGGTINPFFSSTADKFNEGTGTTFIGSGEYGITDDVYMSSNHQTVPTQTYYNLVVRTNNGKIATIGTGGTLTTTGYFGIKNPAVAGGVATTAGIINIGSNLYLGHDGTNNLGNGYTFNVGHRIYRGTGTGVSYMGAGDNANHKINITYLDANGAGNEAFTGFGTPTFYGTVDYGGIGTQEIIGANFYTLNINKNLSASGTKELLGNISVSNELKIWSGTLSATDGTTARTISLQGNFTNFGTFTPSTGKVICAGTAAQIIGGNNTSFYDFEINKASNSVSIINTNGILITNNMDFTAGDLLANLSGSPVVFETTANITTAASNSSHVNGYVAKNHNAAIEFTYPCGDGITYRPCSTTPSDATAQTYRVKYNASAYADLTVKTSDIINHVLNAEYWNIDNTAGIPNAKVKLSWDANSKITGVEAEADLVVAHYDGADWESTTTGVVTLNSIAKTLQSSFTASFSPFGFASKIAPLPIELLSFDAQLNNNQVKLQWETATEINNDYFTIEKTKEGFNWKNVAEMEGAGNSNIELTYRTKDSSPYQGISYYRLKQTDFDGTYTYSDIRAIYNAHDKDIKIIVSNPLVGIQNTKNKPLTITLTNSIGSVIFQKNIQQSTFFNLNEYANGVYFLKVLNLENNTIKSQKLIR